MKIEYVKKNFTGSSKEMIIKANEIIEEYTAQGYDLTLRQLYYQFVSRDIIPNNIRSYKRLGSIVNDAKLAGLIDWDAIDDLTRTFHKRASWDNPSEIVRAAIMGYHIDRWRFASNYVEVWVEKEALVNIVARATHDYDVPYMACKGYPSGTAVFEAACRFKKAQRAGQVPYLIYLGDHDPSGLDISRDIQDRLSTFRTSCQVIRIALNMDQVEQYNPPPNPAKLTDARANGYIDKFGDESWELDALEPSVITDLIQSQINILMDDDEFEQAKALEDAGKTALSKALSFISKEDLSTEDPENDDDGE